MTQVPAQYQGWVRQAASGTGLPASVVAAQIHTESGFDPSVTSPAGAQGIAQFMPGTWATLGVPGSPYDPQAALAGYQKYMGGLLREFHGNVRDALAAYNAGPQNLAAGYGYADSILSAAGASQGTTAAPSAPGGSGGLTGALSGLSGVVAGVPVAGAFVVLGGLLLLVTALWAGRVHP